MTNTEKRCGKNDDAIDALLYAFEGRKWRKQYYSLPWYKKILRKLFWRNITRLFKNKGR